MGTTWAQAAHGRTASWPTAVSEIKARAEGIGMPVYPDKGRGLTDVGVGHYYQ